VSPYRQGQGSSVRNNREGRTNSERDGSNLMDRDTRGETRRSQVSLRRLTAFLLIGVLSTVVCPLSGASAATSDQRTHSLLLPSDGWKPGRRAMEAISSARFHATLTHSGPCTAAGLLGYLWPAGYRVRFHPTVLLDPTGRIVAHQGQYVTVGGGIVGTASWPSAAHCYKEGTVFAIQSPVQVGRPGLLPVGTSSSP
jgi:hypothetical protein